MKNVKVFHGTAGTPEHFWFTFLKSNLDVSKYQVWIPQLPDTDKPELNKWLTYAMNNTSYDENSILIGHSAGCPLILSILADLPRGSAA